MSGNTVVLPPIFVGSSPPPSAGYGYSGGGFGYQYGGGFGFGVDMNAIANYVRYLAGLNQNYFDQQGYENHHNYVDPESDKYLYDALVNFALPQLGSTPAFLAEAYGKNLSKADFTLLKTQALKGNWAIQLGMAGATASQDIDNGVAPQVAIGTQVLMLGFSAAAITLISTGVVLGAGALAGISLPGVAVSLAVGFGVSLAIEKLELKEKLSSGLESLLELLGIEKNGGPDEPLVLTDYDLYRVTKELVDNPQFHSGAEAMLGELLQAVQDSQPVAEGEPADNMPLDRDVPTLVNFVDLDAVDGLKSFEAQGQGALLFIGEASDTRMVGGDGLNWFMPVVDAPFGEAFSTTIIGGSGYNVLDFSLNSQGVDIALSGNDLKNARIEQIALENGWAWHSYFNEESISHLRSSFPIQELQSMSNSLWSCNVFKNIDLIIGSAYDDILIGDWLGGITLTGGAGNDEFVVHGGNNRILFMDGDFAAPDSGEITRKTIHGLLMKYETDIFNTKYYLPHSGQHFKLEPDFLDFSAMDADLTQEGRQSFTYLEFWQEFSGTPGELRVDIQADRMVIQGDRTGDGLADFEVEYFSYSIEFVYPYIASGGLIDLENLIL